MPTGPRCSRTRRLAALILLAGPIPARAAPPPGVTLSKGQILLVQGSPALGFFTVTNTSDQALLMTGWSTPACGALQLEEAGTTAGGVSKLTLPGKQEMVLAPGGYHLICSKPTPALHAGATVPVTVSFDGGATLTAPFQVQAGSREITR